MKLYWCAKTRAFRALWMVEELGVEYERVVVDIRDEARQNDPEFAIASPMGKVPALSDGGRLSLLMKGLPHLIRPLIK